MIMAELLSNWNYLYYLDANYVYPNVLKHTSFIDTFGHIRITPKYYWWSSALLDILLATSEDYHLFGTKF